MGQASRRQARPAPAEYAPRVTKRRLALVSRRREGFEAADCHVIVDRSSEVIEVAQQGLVVAKAPTGRAAAFLRLADEHLDSAYRLARAILRDPAEAQDATHDAFVQAWQKWATLHDPAAFEHWFDRILVNTCRNRLQSGNRRRTTDISAEIGLTAGADDFGGALDRHVL